MPHLRILSSSCLKPSIAFHHLTGKVKQRNDCDFSGPGPACFSHPTIALVLAFQNYAFAPGCLAESDDVVEQRKLEGTELLVCQLFFWPES